MNNDEQDRPRRTYHKPTLTSSVPFERLALSCNGVNPGGESIPPPASKNFAACQASGGS